MRVRRYFAPAVLAILCALCPLARCEAPAADPSANANTIAILEDFSSSPVLRGWKVFGEADLLSWNEANGDLEVAWNSSRANSYFYLPLGTILTRYDDFSLSVDLTLHDIAAGVNPDKPGTFQLAFGFQNARDAQDPGFRRGSQTNTPNLVEFNFFPDTGFGPTVWPAVLSSNSAINYNGSGDFSIFALPTGVKMRVSLGYTSSNETVAATVTADGNLVGPVASARLSTNSSGFSGKPFTQFMVDAFAIATYSDAGQNGAFAGSILAHGTIDNVSLTFPPPPIRQLRGRRNGDRWEASFVSRAHWSYALERSGDLKIWFPVGPSIQGTGGLLLLSDHFQENTRGAFYRINCQPRFE